MKKLFSILLVACLLMPVCAGAMAEEFKGLDSSDYSQFPLVKEGEKLTITVAHIRDAAYGVDVEDMWFWTWAEKVTGIDFQVQQILSSSRADLLPLMFAGGDVPDLLLGLNLTTAEISRYGVSEGQLKDLTEWITPERMPYLSAWFEAYPEAKALCITPDGALYPLPGFQNIVYTHGVGGNTTQFNVAWMEANNQEAPKTLDELVALLYAHKAAMPDGTPVASHASKRGAGTNESGILGNLMYAFGFIGGGEYGIEVAIKDGKAVLPAGHQDFKAYLELLKKFYDDGIMMKDYYTADDLAVQTLIQENKSLMAGQVYHIIPDAARFQEWKYLSPVSSEYTATPLAKVATPFKVGACMIGASVTDEELDALLRFLDFFYCEIGGLYTWDGPVAGSDDLLGFSEGWVYDYSTGSTGSRIFLDVAAGKYSSGTEYVKGVIGANCIGFGNRSHSLTNEKLTYMYEITQYVQDPTMENFVPYVWAEDHGDGWARIHIKANVAPYAVPGFPEIVYFDEDTQEAVDEIRMVMDAYIETNVAKFVTGARDLAEFDQFVKEIEDLGLRDLEEIYQEAYDAYLAAK